MMMKVFTKIQVDIVNIKEFYNVESVCLLGDLNGRTGSEPDQSINQCVNAQVAGSLTSSYGGASHVA